MKPKQNMNRKEFLKMASMLGLGALAFATRANAKQLENVIVVGAGAAGMTAGYRLRQSKINFQILEASETHGGRMKVNRDFADFPLPMGAEWLHTSPRVFSRIVNDPSVTVNVETVGYARDETYGRCDGAALTLKNSVWDTDRKFVNLSWYDFYDQYIYPAISDRITFNDPATAIDTSGEGAVITTNSGAHYTADAVIVTVPLKMLQRGRIAFTPPLSQSKTKAIDQATVWDGFKAFLEFDEAFYPAYTSVEVSPNTAGQHGIYDAAYGQNTDRHIMGLFSVGVAAQQYIGRSEDDVIRLILGQLDAIFDGAATPRFRKIITQDWSNEDYIGGAYIHDHEDWKRVRDLGAHGAGRLRFAGEAYTNGEDWGAVNAAAMAAIRAVDSL